MKINKDGSENIVTISYKIKCIDSARLMVISLSNHCDDLIEGIHKIKCKIVIVLLNMKVPRIV